MEAKQSYSNISGNRRKTGPVSDSVFIHIFLLFPFFVFVPWTSFQALASLHSVLVIEIILRWWVKWMKPGGAIDTPLFKLKRYKSVHNFDWTMPGLTYLASSITLVQIFKQNNIKLFNVNYPQVNGNDKYFPHLQ